MNTVDTSKATTSADHEKDGYYTVGLSLKDANGGSTYKKVRVHVVENEAPVIECEDKVIVEGNKFTYDSLGAKAYDNAQYGKDSKDVLTPYKDLTSEIKYSGNVDINTPGTYEVTLTVSDGMKTTKKVVKVTVDGNRETTISSRDSIKVSVGEELTREHFKKLINLQAFDYEDKDITDSVELVGFEKISTNYAGEYTVQLKVADSKGVIVTKNVVVYVIEKNPAITPVQE